MKKYNSVLFDEYGYMYDPYIHDNYLEGINSYNAKNNRYFTAKIIINCNYYLINIDKVINLRATDFKSGNIISSIRCRAIEEVAENEYLRMFAEGMFRYDKNYDYNKIIKEGGTFFELFSSYGCNIWAHYYGELSVYTLEPNEENS